MLLTQAVTLGRSVITARLLTPDDFGLFGMVATVLTALGALTVVSLDQAILPGHLDAKDEDVRRRLDVTWMAEIVRGLGAALLLAAAAYPTARFYGRAELTPLLYVASLVLLTRGLQNVGLATLRNRIEFRRLFWHELGRRLSLRSSPSRWRSRSATCGRSSRANWPGYSPAWPSRTSCTLTGRDSHTTRKSSGKSFITANTSH